MGVSIQRGYGIGRKWLAARIPSREAFEGAGRGLYLGGWILLLTTLMLVAWQLLRVAFPKSPKLCVMGLFGWIFSISMAMACASNIPMIIGSLLFPVASPSTRANEPDWDWLEESPSISSFISSKSSLLLLVRRSVSAQPQRHLQRYHNQLP